MRKKSLLYVAAAILIGSAFSPINPRKIAPQPDDPARAHTEPDSASWILVISDVHLTGQSTPSKFGKDTHADLWDWILKKVDSILMGASGWRRPVLILCLGDLPCHESNEHDAQKRAAYARTVKETLTQRAEDAHIPIVFAPGNNDYPEGDYCATDTGYYARTLDIGNKKIKVIALNTVPYAPRDTCAAGKETRQQDVDAQMAWLDGQLESVAPQEKAILIMHIPPGKDGFKKAKDPLWDNTLSNNGKTVQQQFLGIIAAHRDKIAGILAGHSHKDGLRVLCSTDDTTAGVLLSIPSISPVYNNNPGFKMISYDPSTLEWDNCITFYTDLTVYTHTGTWDLHHYDLRTVLSLEPGPLCSRIQTLSKDSVRLVEAIRPIYYVKSKLPGVDTVDNIGRTIFVREGL